MLVCCIYKFIKFMYVIRLKRFSGFFPSFFFVMFFFGKSISVTLRFMITFKHTYQLAGSVILVSI